MKGIFKIDEKRGFKIGTYAFAVASRENGDSLSEYINKLSKGGDILTVINCFYGAAVHYAKDNNLPINFTASHVSDWLEEIGYDKVKQMLEEGLEQYHPKNSESPQETGMVEATQ